MFLAPTLAKVGVAFGPPECFTLMLTSLMIVTYLVRGSMIRALIMVELGLVLGTLGNDPLTVRVAAGVLMTAFIKKRTFAKKIETEE